MRTFSGRFHEDFPATAGLLLVIAGFFILELTTQQKLPPLEGGALGLGGADPRILEILGWCQVGQVIEDRQVWRILAAIFLHGGIIHAAFNGWVLMDLGRTCEPMLGTGRFLTIYVASGIGGSLASLGNNYWRAEHLMAAPGSVGASGALCGLIGLLLAFSIRHRDRELRRQMVRWLIYLAIFSIAIPSIDHAGHLGGALTGFVFGLFVPRYVTSDSARRWLIPCWIAIILSSAALGFSVWNLLASQA